MSNPSLAGQHEAPSGVGPVPSTHDAETLQATLAALAQRFGERVVRVKSGAQVAVRECGQAGDAPSVVLLHGISSGAASWLQSALLASEHAHVMAWDAPGYGVSTALAAPAPTASDYAERLHELLQALEVKRIVLVGHSLGALMACAYARRLGAATVVRLVLISPAGGYAGSAERERVRSQRREALREHGIAGLAQRIDQRLLSSAADETARAWVRWNAMRLNPQGYLQAVELLCNGDLGAGPALRVPVEVHCGEFDVVTPPVACQRWATVFDAPFELIAHGGHASPVEQPAAVARLLARSAGAASG